MWWVLVVLMPSLAWADVVVTVHGHQRPEWGTTIAIWGEGATGPLHEKALRVTMPTGQSSVTIPTAKIRAAFPATDWIGVTAQYVALNGAVTPWWTYPDGSYTYKQFPMGVPVTPPPVVPPPVVPPPPVGPTVEQRLSQLEASVRSGFSDLADLEARMIMLKSAVCQSKASAGSLTAKLRAALGGCP